MSSRLLCLPFRVASFPAVFLAVFLTAFLTLFALAGSASAATVNLLKVDGIPGDSTAPGFEAFLGILDYAASAGVDPSSPNVVFRPLEVTKGAGVSDAALFERLAKKTLIANACALTYVSGATNRPVNAIGLGGVRVTNITPTSTTDSVLQSLTLSYTQISIITYLYNNNGNPIGTQSYCWDVTTNATCGNNLLSCPAN